MKNKRYLNQNTPNVKKLQPRTKKGQSSPPAVDEIKIFDNDDKAAKLLRMFCGLVIIIKNFNFIDNRRP